MAQERLFCFGFGYSARALAAALAARGWHIAGTVRDPQATPRQEGVERAAFDGTAPLSPEGRAMLAAATHVLVSIPPTATGDPVLAWHAADLVANRRHRWIGYLSSTSVYGDHAGAWVDEETPPAPVSERGRRRLAAERAWLALHRAQAAPVHVFRLAGIYGPGRNAFVSLRAGRAHRIEKPGHVSCRIHVDDLRAVLIASMTRPRAGAIYNVCDDLPAPPADVLAYAAGKMGVAPPPLRSLEEADLSPMARSFYAECRRVSNRRLREELGVRLRFPDYRAGLDALLAIDGGGS